MTALPPTKGHLNLIKFAASLADHVKVIVCTQPDEPFPTARYNAISQACHAFHNIYVASIEVSWYNREIEQNAQSPGFWDMWRKIMETYGFQPGDLIVASESYGQHLADACGGKFMPYDMNRDIYTCKASYVRRLSREWFHQILPEFQINLRQTVTIFGAESTGKTTLANTLAICRQGHFLFEYARPYLQTCGTEITNQSMTDIWHGQRALQRHAEYLYDMPWVVQDTDLFSTVGYWNLWHDGKAFPGTVGTKTPEGLIADAEIFKADLYLITPSNIDFEPDAIRYGGNKRESDDQYWIDLCKQYKLNYHVLTESNKFRRVDEASSIMKEHWNNNVHPLIQYDRKFNG